ncbi:HAMP domain-containing sensor histidine kinase [Metabacillus idriensis]|uniref:sensor histidine kinase n=1 Tax=Metabacillus idriensis TaxID=324768 RepID=UPI002813E4B2|nr:HAMP domain-containing sensor histidine kinase [Metabacillus idriensis]MDR0136209.1 HAMP domain-containing sensor histidine kinase [Metabacillus idriensis]
MIRLNLSQKVLMLIGICIVFSILFSFFFLHFLYKELYFNSIKESVIYQGERTAAHYHYGSLSDEIIEKIHWYNVVSEYEVIVLDDIEDLSSYFPYEVDYEALITSEDRETLENGEYIVKDGYVKEFNHEIIGAVFPIMGDKGLIGFIYIYVPLADLQEVFEGSLPILLLVGSLFFMILFLAVNQIRRSLFKPLNDFQEFSKEVSKGNYSNRLVHNNHDEIGQLAHAFNSMSQSLEEQEARKKEFLANVVHELRTPLTYIGGYSQALKHQMYASAEEADHYLMTIDRETNRLNKLITDLIDLDHLQENMYTLNVEPIAIVQLFLDTLALFDIRINENKLKTELDIQEDLALTGDPKRLQQVFYNLLDNAIKYADDESKIKITLIEENNQLLFRLNNNGNEISEEDIAHIGERFFRSDKARSRMTGGTGLGISIVKEIVRLHKGEFLISSDSTNGTTVTVMLPGLI